MLTSLLENSGFKVLDMTELNGILIFMRKGNQRLLKIRFKK